MKDDKGDLDLTLRIDQLEKQKKILQDSIRQFKKRTEEAEGETTIVKGIGLNSPEMRALKMQVTQLEKDNIELRRDNTLLAHDVATLNNRLNEMNPLPGLRRRGM
jgi:hypothetical protein